MNKCKYNKDKLEVWYGEMFLGIFYVSSFADPDKKFDMVRGCGFIL